MQFVAGGTAGGYLGGVILYNSVEQVAKRNSVLHRHCYTSANHLLDDDRASIEVSGGGTNMGEGDGGQGAQPMNICWSLAKRFRDVIRVKYGRLLGLLLNHGGSPVK
jgi:hypothetical protein